MLTMMSLVTYCERNVTCKRTRSARQHPKGCRTQQSSPAEWEGSTEFRQRTRPKTAKGTLQLYRHCRYMAGTYESRPALGHGLVAEVLEEHAASAKRQLLDMVALDSEGRRWATS